MPQRDLQEVDPAGPRKPVFRVLGPLEMWNEDIRINPGGSRQRHVLATLLIYADKVVPVGRLVRAVWGEDVPHTADNQIRKMVWDLRRRLPDSVPILTEPPGYRLVVGEGQLDARCFETLLSRAETAVAEDRVDAAVKHLSDALGLWRGRALSGMTGSVVTSGGRDLDERRLVATERCIDLRLARGEARALVPDLYSLVAAHPLHEGLRERLMLALYRIGRRAEALDVMAQGRVELVELGIEPGTGLCRLQERILNDDPSLTLPEPEPDSKTEPEPRAVASGDAPTSTTPAAPKHEALTASKSTDTLSLPQRPHGNLPYDLPDFTGRRRELDVLMELGARVSDQTPTIVTLTGMPGMGKTALAVHAAHRLSGAFPEGQLFLDLQGLTPNSGPPALADALQHLLLTLGTPSDGIPEDLVGRLVTWRRAVAGRRVLMVLDGVEDTATIRPLLPGTGGCLVMVTSRTVVADLDGAVPLPLAPLPEADATDLLGRIIGVHRIGDAAEACALVTACGRLPLAVRIMGARLSNRPSWSLEYAVHRMHRHDLRLRELTFANRSVAAGIDQCYRRLSPAQQHLLLALRSTPSGGFDDRTAALLAGVPTTEAEDALDGLVDACLLHALPHPGRYALPELIRSFAVQKATAAGSGTGPTLASMGPREHTRQPVEV
ncbi:MULTISPECIES: BTAD domain-containing putative transcriptional regulator [unclassified Streptomyces]|uniref:AfsR/SARP family transcriptional regulator n=1 Tax=unclassified Streptomyces TaxID=2593676 RepID=UPI0029BDB66F|nr:MULTISPECIES: BTAD domain-containing putative transcriptional regulator [unclassified Streptomyces]MDX3772384.1 BTAD domain-containing putative transcriptional regulator [Streptomyces sp. AK08-01B]MDX3821882.1 BTAD domain-containing putative transcriptional regulator [Streptomyces sp. AK08-01A]